MKNKRLTRIAARSFAQVSTLSIFLLITGSVGIYMSKKLYDKHSYFLDKGVNFAANSLTEQAIESDSKFELIIANNFFSEIVRESKAVKIAKKTLPDKQKVHISDKYFSSLWDLLDYFHVMGLRELAYNIELHFVNSKELWSYGDCDEDEDVSYSECNAENLNDRNLDSFFYHVNNVYLIPSLLYYHNGQMSEGYHLLKKANSILKATDTKIEEAFSYYNLNKAYILNVFINAIYNQNISIKPSDIMLLMNMDVEQDGFGASYDDGRNLYIELYANGVRQLRENCNKKAIGSFVRLFEQLRADDLHPTPLSSLVAYMVVRASVRPAYRLGSLRLEVTRNDSIGKIEYFKKLEIEDCKSRINIDKFISDSRQNLEKYSKHVTQFGLRRDIQEFKKIVPSHSADSARIHDFVEKHSKYVCGNYTVLTINDSVPKSNGLYWREEDFCKFSEGGRVESSQNTASNLGGEEASDQIQRTPTLESSDAQLQESVSDLTILGDWIEILNTDSLASARDTAEGFRKELEIDLGIFRVENSRYSVALGPYAIGNADRRLERMRKRNLIPETSTIKSEADFLSLESGGEGLLVLNIQEELTRIGCEPGRKDGDWGPATRFALETAEIKGLSADRSKPSKGLLTALKALENDFCRAESGSETSADYEIKPMGLWIQVFSRKEREEALELAERYKEEVSKDVAVFIYHNGWYVGAIGPFASENAGRQKASLLRSRKIPKDSLISEGHKLGNLDWGGEGLLVLNIQEQLSRLGCNPGQKDGDWGPSTQKALTKAIEGKSESIDISTPNIDILRSLSKINSNDGCG